jgi:hypothetical protein
MAQYHTNNARLVRRESTRSPRILPQAPTRLFSTNSTGSLQSPALAPILEPEAAPSPLQLPQDHNHKVKHFDRPTIRVDACLGEWLSPDYYESITPPPDSDMMLASAKGDLLRAGDYNEVTTDHIKTPKGFPGGWGGSTGNTDSTTPPDDSTFSLASLSDALHSRDRASSMCTVPSMKTRTNFGSSQSVLSADGGYIPPTPAYAISPFDPIPSGYAAHARDACVHVDYQWDSQGEPQNWGNGGEYGEEWGTMHKRFRRGLQSMVAYYRDADVPGGDGRRPTHDGGRHRSRSGRRSSIDSQRSNASNHWLSNDETSHSNSNSENDDDFTDTVVVLVTHGAGCNALIGALTNQPVLLDVPMASLTMAVRKDITDRSTSPSETRSTPAIYKDYDVKLVASTEHLRADANPLVIPSLIARSNTVGRSKSPNALSLHRHRQSPIPSTVNGMNATDGRTNSANAIPQFRSSFNQRAPTRSFTLDNPQQPSRSFSGLWGGAATTTPPAEQMNPFEKEEEGDDIVLDFRNSEDFHASLEQTPKDTVEKRDARKESPELSPNTSPPNGTTDSGYTTDATVTTVTTEDSPQMKAQSRKPTVGLWGSSVGSAFSAEPEPQRTWTLTDRN